MSDDTVERPTAARLAVYDEAEAEEVEVKEAKQQPPKPQKKRKLAHPLTWWIQQVNRWHISSRVPSTRELARKRKELVERLGIEAQLKELERIAAQVRRLEAEHARLAKKLAPKFRRLLQEHQQYEATSPDTALNSIALKELREQLDQERERLVSLLTHAVTASEKRAAIAEVEKVIRQQEPQ